MSKLNGKKILLIAAELFNYEKEIENELERQGAEVNRYDQRPSNDFLTKVFIRLNMKLFVQKKIDIYYANIIDECSKIEYDYIFLVSPEAINADTLQKIKDSQKKAKVYIYMWDSIKNKKQALSLLPLSDRFFTFDSTDMSSNDKIKFLPLFYINNYEEVEHIDKPLYDIVFIGTVHSDRYRLVKKIEQIAIENGLSTYLYFYSPSRLLFWIKKFTDKNFFFIKAKDISFNSLSQVDILSIIKKTKSIVDIEHPSQNGLTMRTIEMLGAKRKIITTNKNIKSYDFYNTNNILVVDRDDIQIDSNFFQKNYEKIDSSIYVKYSINNWIKQIFK